MNTPFSILDTRTKDWKDRKRWWVDTYKIRSDLGRQSTQSKSTFLVGSNNVSIFDPVLSELMYNWFCPPSGSILDPFAGGSVRGIVADELGYTYTGIDISEEQILENQKQSSTPKQWIVGDSDGVLDICPDEGFDMVLTCPPYYDLEIYTDNPNDLSKMSVDDFDIKYKRILQKTAAKLKNNRFFVIIVSEVREPSVTGKYSTGKYRGLVRKTIDYLEDAGLEFYNDMVLFNSQYQASRVAKMYFNRNRKIPSVHQNVLVFIKGNPDIATEEITSNDKFVCEIEGKRYHSFRHAAIDIDPNTLVATEVERRCRSTKLKYKNWQVIGEETRPVIKYEVDGIPFESPIQIAELIGGDFTEQTARNYINSNNPSYRHWKQIDSTLWDISYDDMEELWGNDIRITLPVIECEGIEFYSMEDAANHFGISKERVRQKVISNRFVDWKYLFEK
jgi:hypothetical protein